MPSSKLYLEDDARSGGIHIQGTRGSGKSTLASLIGLADFYRGYAVVIFEFQGGLIEQLIWRLRKLDFSREVRNRLLDRITYVDMSGQSGRVFGWPLLYKLPKDSLFHVSRRFPNLMEKLDPELASAPILGARALRNIGT